MVRLFAFQPVVSRCCSIIVLSFEQITTVINMPSENLAKHMMQQMWSNHKGAPFIKSVRKYMMVKLERLLTIGSES